MNSQNQVGKVIQDVSSTPSEEDAPKSKLRQISSFLSEIPEKFDFRLSPKLFLLFSVFLLALIFPLIMMVNNKSQLSNQAEGSSNKASKTFESLLTLFNTKGSPDRQIEEATPSPQPTFSITATPIIISLTPTLTLAPIIPTSTLKPTPTPTLTPTPTSTPTLTFTPTPTIPPHPVIIGINGPFSGWTSTGPDDPGGTCFTINADQVINRGTLSTTVEFKWQLDNNGWSVWSPQYSIKCFGTIPSGNHTVYVKARVDGWNESEVFVKPFTL